MPAFTLYKRKCRTCRRAEKEEELVKTEHAEELSAIECAFAMRAK